MFIFLLLTLSNAILMTCVQFNPDIQFWLNPANTFRVVFIQVCNCPIDGLFCDVDYVWDLESSIMVCRDWIRFRHWWTWYRRDPRKRPGKQSIFEIKTSKVSNNDASSNDLSLGGRFLRLVQEKMEMVVPFLWHSGEQSGRLLRIFESNHLRFGLMKQRNRKIFCMMGCWSMLPIPIQNLPEKSELVVTLL